MWRWGIIAAGAVIFCLVASQILIPNLGERRLEDRLTGDGGQAEATMGAFPAARLLFSDGERFELDARDLDLDLDREPGGSVLERLDGFAMVEITIEDSRAGPFELESFELSRDHDGPYRLLSSGETTATALADYGLEAVEVPGESLADLILGELLGEDAEGAVPVELDLELRSEGGGVEVVSGDGAVAGFETGPLAELLTKGIVVQL